MPQARTGLNLPSLGLSVRVLFTGYLLVVSVGLLVALAQILATHGMADGRLGLSVDDIVYSYYGNRGNSRIEAKLEGTMKDKAGTQDRASIVRWVRSGSPEAEWNSEISGIFTANCVHCHGIIPGLPDFRTLEGVRPYVAIDQGASLTDLTRFSHIHIFSIAFIYFFLCGIFSLAIGLPRLVKATVIAIPFAFLLLDAVSWWLTKWYPSFAWLTILGGIGQNLAAAFMIVTSTWQMWRLPRLGRPESPWFEE